MAQQSPKQNASLEQIYLASYCKFLYKMRLYSNSCFKVLRKPKGGSEDTMLKRTFVLCAI